MNSPSSMLNSLFLAIMATHLNQRNHHKRHLIVNLENESNGFKFRKRAKFEMTLSPNLKEFSSFSEFRLTLSPNSLHLEKELNFLKYGDKSIQTNKQKNLKKSEKILKLFCLFL